VDRQPRRGLGAVQQRQALLRAELQRLQPGVCQRPGGRNTLAVDERLADADQHAGQVRQRRQVARRTDRTLLGYHRQYVVCQQCEQRLDHRRPHARDAVRQAC
jgi:hypothetical protein